MKEDSRSKGLSPEPKFSRYTPTTMETLESEGNARWNTVQPLTTEESPDPKRSNHANNIPYAPPPIVIPMVRESSGF